MPELKQSDPETENLEVCVEMAIAEEREACAKLAEADMNTMELGPRNAGANAALRDIAQAIRNRK